MRTGRHHIPPQRAVAAFAAACACLLAAAPAAPARDRTPPRIISAVTGDTDADGHIDVIRVRYSEKVGLLPGKGSMRVRASGYTVNSRHLGSPRTRLPSPKRCYPGRSIRRVSRAVVLKLAESSAFDTDLTPAAIYTRTGKSGRKVVDGSCNEAYTGVFRSTRDGAKPVLLSGETADLDADGKIDAVKLTFSEALDYAGQNAGPYPFTVSGRTVTSTDSTSTSKLTVKFGEGGSFDTGATPGVTYTPGSGKPVQDAVSLTAPARSIPTDDGAGPAMVGAVTRDLDGNGKLDHVHLTFSEPVTHLDQATGPFPVAVENRTVTAVGAPSGNQLDVTIAEAGIDTGDLPGVNYTGAGGSQVKDGANNQAAVNGVSPTDGAGPVMVSGMADEQPAANGLIDLIQTTWSEPVLHAADSDGSYPFSVTNPSHPIAPSGIPAVTTPSLNLNVPLVEGASPDRDKSPSISYAAAGPAEHVTDAAGNEAANGAGTVVATPACVDPNEDNDSDDDSLGPAARPLGTDKLQERLCGGDEDWYLVQVATAPVTLKVLVEPADTIDPKVELRDSGGGLVGSTQNGGGAGENEVLSVDVATPGAYYVRVFSDGFSDGGYCTVSTQNGETPECGDIIFV